jgi:hypothetical protein
VVANVRSVDRQSISGPRRRNGPHARPGTWPQGKGGERAVIGQRSAFDDAGEWIGIIGSDGAVFDADGVQVGVQWPTVSSSTSAGCESERRSVR